MAARGVRAGSEAVPAVAAHLPMLPMTPRRLVPAVADASAARLLDDPNGPPGGGRPPLAGRGRPEIGHVLPPFVRNELGLTHPQGKKIAALESEVKGKLESILTPRSFRQLHDLLDRGPAGPGGRGPGGGPGRGDAPGEGPPDDDDPPVRPRRPRQP